MFRLACGTPPDAACFCGQPDFCIRRKYARERRGGRKDGMNGALEKNQRLTLSCARLGSELEGVCSYEGMAVFVPGVLPGETAEVQIVKALPTMPSDGW